MRVGAFELHDPAPDLRDPHIFVMVRPWIDVGSSVSITLAELEGHFGAKEMARLARPGIFFDFTLYRPRISLVEGRRQIVIPNSVVNHARTKEGQDLVFMHLMEPHNLGEDYAAAVLKLLEHIGIGRYCRLGSMYDAVSHTRPLRVTGTTGGVLTKGNAGDLKRRRSTYQGPTTIMNLVSQGVEKLVPPIVTMSLMVHLPQYLQLEEDYMGAARLLDVLSSMYELPPDLPTVERGRVQYGELEKAVDGNPELKTLIERIEAQFDAEEAAEDGKQPSDFSPDVESFLQEMDRRFADPDQPG